MFFDQSTMFIIPQEVIDQINAICHNYFWGGVAEYTKSPYISWSTTYTPKKYGGIGLKNLSAWNKASIIKLVWCIALKKDILWEKWIHTKYLKTKDWWTYQPPSNCNWYWRKIISIKDLFTRGLSSNHERQWQDGKPYTIKTGYKCLPGVSGFKSWSKMI